MEAMKKGSSIKEMVWGANLMEERVLRVLSSLEEQEKPPNTSQQVLVAVKSEDKILKI